MRLPITILLLSIFSELAAQNSGILKGKLQDSATKQSLSLATVTVFKARDTSIITYRMTGEGGDFKITGLPLNISCRVLISFSGYKVFRKEFQLSSQMPQLDLETVFVATDTAELDEVLVAAERPPVSVRNDTIEFNAASFKTLPTALVEDLLKKLPGVDVDAEGNITVNGRSVNKILVDGKDFFGGDSKIATRNLPANLIDKVQVSDDKEQLAENPNINKADLGQVVNLKLKRSVKKGWFGKAYVGAGTDKRYETGTIINSFRDTLQASLIAYTNNLSRAGFGVNDLTQLGGFNRSGMNNVNIFNEGGVSLNDVSFGGTGQGVQKSTGAGININHNPQKKLGLNFQYFFGETNTYTKQLGNAQQFFNDTILLSRNQSTDNSRSFNHRVSGRIQWKIDSLTNFNFRPSFGLTKNHSIRDAVSNSSSTFQPQLNESINEQRVNGNNISYNHSLTFDRRFKKPGRSFYFNQFLNAYQNKNDQFNDASNTFYSPQTTHTSLNQLRKRENANLNVSNNVNYYHPISKKFNIRFSNSLTYFKSTDDINSFNRDSATLKYEVLNTSLSNGIERNGIREIFTISPGYSVKKLYINPSINFHLLDIHNDFLKNPSIRQNYSYVLAGLYMYVSKWNIGYNASANEPSAGDLQPVIDNTNPLYQSLGNPDLLPTINHTIYTSLYNNVSKKLLSYGFNGNFSLAKNPVIRARTVDDKGVQITRPVNVDNTWRISLNTNFSKQYKKPNKSQFAIRPSINMNFSRNYVILNNNQSKTSNFSVGSTLGWAYNYNDLFEFAQRYIITYNQSHYETAVFPSLQTVTHFLMTEMVVREPKNFVWESTVDYRYNPKVPPGISKNVVKWNAGLNYLFLKDKKGQLKFSVYDLLKQNVNSYRFVRENYIQDIETNALARYFLLTFTYNIREFKAGKVGGRQSFFSF